MSINNVGSVQANISEILDKIRDISSKTKAFGSQATQITSEDFSKVYNTAKSTVDNVNSLVNDSDKIRDSYLSGDKNVSLSQVVVSTEKSKLAFEGLITVRNKCLEAYREIMNMPV